MAKQRELPEIERDMIVDAVQGVYRRYVMKGVTTIADSVDQVSFKERFFVSVYQIIYGSINAEI